MSLAAAPSPKRRARWFADRPIAIKILSMITFSACVGVLLCVVAVSRLSALSAAEQVLKTGGRLAVVSFHSLEDRIVKSFLAARSETRGGSRHAPEVQRAAPSFTVLTKRPVVADDDEIARNPRARSAKLRAGERTAAPAHRDDTAALLPRLPSLDDVVRGR